MSDANLLQVLAKLLRTTHERLPYGIDIPLDDDGITKHTGIGVTDDVFQALRRHQWAFHANDGLGNSEWVLRMIALETILLQEVPRYAFGGPWRELTLRAQDFFSPVLAEKVKRNVCFDADAVLRFMEAAAIVIDTLPAEAIERIYDDARSETCVDGTEEDLAALGKWLAVYKEAQALLHRKEQTDGK